jgi:hypothetical protein
MLFSTNMQDLFFIIYNIVLFYAIFFVPSFFVAIRIFYYSNNIKYSTVNYLIILFNLPVSLVYYFFPNLYDYNIFFDLYLLLTILFIYFIYSIPLCFIICFIMLYRKFTIKDHRFWNDVISKKFMRFLVSITLIYNLIQGILYYLLFKII